MCGFNCGCDECSESLCTSDVTCFDGEFNNIVVPEGADLNDVLLLLESYTDEKFSALNELTFTVTEPNGFGLVAGTYSYTQILNAVNTVLQSLLSDVSTLQSDVTDLDARVDALELGKTYRVNLTQSSTNAPVATVVENEFTGLAWQRNAVGIYQLDDNLTGIFAGTKQVFISPTSSIDTEIKCAFDNDYFQLFTFNSGVLADDVLNGTSLLIQVF